MSEKLYLVDGMAYVFRAYYAFGGNFSNREGFPTNAIYGFKNMLRGLLEKNQAKYLAVVFDSGSKTFRNEIYEKYKANRDEAPQDLKVQFEPIFELVKILQLPLIRLENWEADDIIADLSRKFADKFDEVVIVSSDKDLTQLINDKVSLYDEMKNIKVRRAEVKKKYGVYPEQIAEYLALTGDTSDNIPGAAGIGPKTASDLLEKHQSLQNILQNLEQLKPAVRTKIENSKENIELSLKLTTLNHPLDLEYKFADFIVQKPKQKELADFYIKYGFAQDKLLDQPLKQAEISSEVKINRANYQLITEKEVLEKYLNQIKETRLFAFDLETTSLVIQEVQIVGFALAVAGLPAAYLPVAHHEQREQLSLKDCLTAFSPIFQNPQIRLIAHNIKYEISVLRQYNLQIENKVEDTMLQSYLINADSNQHSLDRLAQIYLNHTMISFSEVAGSGKEQLRFDEIALAKALPYAAEDAEITLKLYELFKPKIKELNLDKLYYQVELPLVPVLAEMEMSGVKIEESILANLSKEMKEQAKKLAQDIYQDAGEEFNINSPKQLGEILFEKMGIQEFKKKTKTGYSTDARVLAQLAKQNPIANKIHNYRTKQKLVNTYLDVLPELVHHNTGRIHTSFRQTIAATGRLSSNDPNLQNIPIRGEEGGKIREAFIAAKDKCLISADYSQIELRLLAHFCKDEKLLTAFKQNKDIHSETAAAIFQTEQITPDIRAIAKAINFGIIYGMGAFKLSQEINVPVKEAKTFIEAYFAKYPKIKEFIETTKEKARKIELVTTLLGRRRKLTGINDKNAMVRASMERIAVNTIIQGSAADLIKLAMLQIADYYKKQGRPHQMILQIHDELVFETDLQEAEARMKIIKEKMEQVYPLLVDLKTDIQKGNNWNEIH